MPNETPRWIALYWESSFKRELARAAGYKCAMGARSRFVAHNCNLTRDRPPVERQP